MSPGELSLTRGTERPSGTPVHPEANAMSRKNGPEPFFRPKKNRWYVEIDGRHINLGPDEAQARVRWHQLMAGGTPRPTAAGDQPPGEFVCRIIDLFVG